MFDRATTIDEIVEGLRFDDRLALISRSALQSADENYLGDLLSDIQTWRGQLDHTEHVFNTKNAEFLEALRRQQVGSSQRKRVSYLLPLLRNEEGPIQRLVELIRTRQAKLRNEALVGKSRAGIYIELAGAIADAASQQARSRTNLDEKIALITLLADSLIGINQVSEAHGSKEFHQLLYNCLRACIEMDALQGFDRHIDRFDGATIAELRRLGPVCVEYIDQAKATAENFAATGDNLEAIDRLLNPADILTIWLSLTRINGDKLDTDRIFARCFELLESALALTKEEVPRVSLVVARFSAAYLRFARLKFESGGAAHRDEILSIVTQATRLLARVTSPDGDLYSPSRDILLFKLRELRLAELAFELDPDIDRLKDYIVSSVLELADKFGARLRTVRPWVTLVRVLSQTYDERADGAQQLEGFAKTTRSPFARERALTALSQLTGAASARLAIARIDDAENSGWLDGMRLHPHSLTALTESLAAYGGLGYGPKGTQATFSLPPDFPDVAYAGLFRHLVDFDNQARMVPIDESSDDQLRTDILLSWFKVRFGKQEIAGLEELSQFLLQRGKGRLYYPDISACVALLRHGLSYSDDAFWYGRLISAYRQMRDLTNASDVARIALKRFPHDSVIAVESALVKVMSGEYRDAATAISDFVGRSAIQLSSCHQAVEGLYAYAMSKSDNHEVAESAYQEIVASRPADWRARHGLAGLLFRKGPEFFPEALRHWTSAVLLCDSSGDLVQASIRRDSILQIAQAVKEMRSAGGPSSVDLAPSLRGIADALPTTSLVDLMKAFAVCGGLQESILLIAACVRARRNRTLSRAFTQSCMSMLVEDSVKQKLLSYSAAVVEFACSEGTLGDLFGGAKGSYTRNLLRISANPIAERNLDIHLQSATKLRLTAQWQAVSHLISTSEYSPNYYADVYESLRFCEQVSKDEITALLGAIIGSNLVTFRREVDLRKIILEESFPRSFSTRREEPISSGLTDRIYNCDPDKLRAALRYFKSSGPQGGEDDTASWTLFGEVEEDIQHALLEANIRTEIAKKGVCVVSISGSSPLH